MCDGGSAIGEFDYFFTQCSGVNIFDLQAVLKTQHAETTGLRKATLFFTRSVASGRTGQTSAAECFSSGLAGAADRRSFDSIMLSYQAPVQLPYAGGGSLLTKIPTWQLFVSLFTDRLRTL